MFFTLTVFKNNNFGDCYPNSFVTCVQMDLDETHDAAITGVGAKMTDSSRFLHLISSI